MKKFKWLALIAALAMLLGAVACSDGDADDDEHIANTASTTTSSSSSSSSTSSSDNSSDDTTTDDDDPDYVTATPVSEGMILVKGTTITGTETISPTSSVFISGRSFTIDDFYMCDHEVTQAEYETYCNYTGNYSPSSTYGVGTNYPAYYVSWYDALVYCNLRSKAEGYDPCYTINSSTDPDKWGDIPTSSDSIWNAAECDFNASGYRLPTEAEWEYAARGGSNWDNYTYAGSNTIDDVAWYNNNSDSTTHEVKKKQANSLGLYDMSGNVCELCYDWYGSITSSTASTGIASGSYRVIRGGLCYGGAYRGLVYFRTTSDKPYNRDDYLGFRVARSL